jgi:tRNA1Val (adenine37-N6)-methyltransferase
VYNIIMVELKKGERIDDLQYKGLRIIQNPELFCFGTDSVLLANFAQVKKGETVADLGTGSGILSILLGGKNPKNPVYALEIQEILADMAQRSADMNGLFNITVIQGDLKEAPRLLPRCQVVICNPPYERVGTGKAFPNECHRIARHEIKCTFADVAAAASGLLGDKGRFYFINRAERMVELTDALLRCNLQPKVARFIHANSRERAKYILMAASKNGGKGLEICPPLIVYNEDGSYSKEVKALCDGDK